MSAIEAVGHALTVGQIADRREPTQALGKGSNDFVQALGRVIGEANDAQIAAEDQSAALVRGEGDVVDAVLALNEADLSLRMLMQVRDRLLQAYQEVMRTV